MLPLPKAGLRRRGAMLMAKERVFVPIAAEQTEARRYLHKCPDEAGGWSSGMLMLLIAVHDRSRMMSFEIG